MSQLIKNQITNFLKKLEEKSQNNEIKLSDYIVSRVSFAGCNHIFSLTGGGIMFLVDAIARQREIDLVCVHNEQFAGAAADAYARISGKIGCAMGTTGPGLANLFTSVVAAYQDSSKVLFIGGQVKSSDSSRLQGLSGMRQNGTFEIDSIDSYKPVTKFCEIIESALDGVCKIETALNIMYQDRPGPALLEVPLDVQNQTISLNKVEECLVKLCKKEDEFIADTRLLEMYKNFVASEKPLLILGAGVLRSGLKKEFVQFLKASKLPYILTPQAIELAEKNENYSGVIGLRGNRSANVLSQQAGNIFIVGSSLHQQIVGWESAKFNPKSEKVWVEVDEIVTNSRAKELNVKNVFNKSLKEFISMVSNENTDHSLSGNWIEYIHYLKDNFFDYTSEDKNDNELSYYDVIESLNNSKIKYSNLVTDAGMAWYIIPQALRTSQDFNFVSSGSLGAMGMAIPYGLGAMNANSNNRTIVITGDGSLMTCIQELASIRVIEKPIVILIVNNNGYRSIRATHDKFFNGLKIGTDGSNGVFIPNIKDIALTFDYKYFSAKSSKELDQVFSDVADSMINHIMIEAFIKEDQDIEPLVVSVRNENGQFETPSIDVMFPNIKVRNYDDSTSTN